MVLGDISRWLCDMEPKVNSKEGSIAKGGAPCYPMFCDGHAVPDGGNLIVIDISNGDACGKGVLQTCHNCPPRIDYEAVSVALAALVVPSSLRCRDNVCLRLDGASSEQHFPVGFPYMRLNAQRMSKAKLNIVSRFISSNIHTGRLGESRGNGQNDSSHVVREVLIHLRET